MVHTNKQTPILTIASLSKLLTIEQVGAALSVPPHDVKKLCRKYNVAVVKIGHKIRMKQSDYEELVEKMRTYYG
jgi:hypothetical protein